MIEYAVIIEPAEDGSGAAAEEARERIAFSIPPHIESLRAHGEPVPASRAVVDRITVAA